MSSLGFMRGHWKAVVFFFFYFCCSFSLLFIRTAQHTPNSPFNNLLMLGEEKKIHLGIKAKKLFVIDQEFNQVTSSTAKKKKYVLKPEQSKDVSCLSKQIVRHICVLHRNRFIENLKWNVCFHHLPNNVLWGFVLSTEQLRRKLFNSGKSGSSFLSSVYQLLGIPGKLYNPQLSLACHHLIITIANICNKNQLICKPLFYMLSSIPEVV